MSTVDLTTEHTETLHSRRANDYIVDAKRFKAPAMLFDEFWREGELALMFGAPASGKSVLAVQLGDALSRGGGLQGFRAPPGRRRVLYVDLRHNDEQFQVRCIREGA
ncbi:MAG TPA: AAA family ATPase, partial [Pyrinomonadaceae bacterium]|nr:AAA family ATPase [Pyrinomonadaceae bacterium]